MSARQPQITSTEKTRLKSRSTVRTYLLSTPRVTSFATAEVASVGTFPISQLGTTNESADWANIREGQTVWIGSAAGLKDRGVYWARFVQTTGQLYIGRSGRGDAGALSSDDRTEIEVGDHITVWPDHQPHAGRSRIQYDYGSTTGTFYKLFDRAYGTQNSTPGPYFQGDTHKGYRLPSGSSTIAVSMTVEAKTHKAAPTITGYSWISYPASFTSVSGTATATLTANAPLGFHVCICRATQSDGAYEDAIRYIWVYNSTNVIELSSGAINRTVSGASYAATLADDLRGDLDTESMCMVIEESTWAAGTVSTATTKFIGYLQGGSGNSQYGKRGSSITLVDPGQILAALGNDSQILEVATSPAHWQQAIAELMTIRYFIWYLLRWHAVNWNSLFCYYPDTTSTQSNSPLKVNEGTIWSQIEDLAKRIALAPIACDSDGDLHWGVIGSYTDPDPAARAALTLRDDSLDETTIKEFSFTEQARPVVRTVTVGAFQWDGTTQNAVRSIAPSRDSGQAAGKDRPPGLIINTQDDLDLLAGLIYGYQNRRIKTMTFVLSGNYDVYEPAHRDRVYFAVPAAPSPDGIAKSGYGRVIGVNKVIGLNGAVSVTITVEPETVGSAGEPYPYPPAGAGTGTGAARPFGAKGTVAPKIPTSTKLLPARPTTYGPSTAPNNQLAFWALAKDASGSGFRVVTMLKTGASSWQGRDISPTSGQRSTLGAAIKLIEMRRNVKGLILLCESGIAYTNDYTAKTVTWVTPTQGTSTVTYYFTETNGGFSTVIDPGDPAPGVWTSGTGWENTSFLSTFTPGTYKSLIDISLTFAAPIAITMIRETYDFTKATIIDVVGNYLQILNGGVQQAISTTLSMSDSDGTGKTRTITGSYTIDQINMGLRSRYNTADTAHGTGVITKLEIVTTATCLGDIVQSVGGNVYWLTKINVGGTDYVYLNFSRNNFQSSNSTQVAKYDSALTYNIQVSDTNPAYVWVSAGTTSDSTAKIYYSSNGGVSFTAGAALNTRGGAFRLPRSLPGGSSNKQHKNIVYVKGVSTNLQGVRDGSSAATISTGSSDYPQTAQSLVSYFKDGNYVAVMLKSRDLYLSSNGGQSWAYTSAAPGTGNAYTLTGWYNNHKLLLAGGDQALAYTEDRGLNWVNMWSTYNTFRSAQFGGTVAQIILSAAFATYPTFTKPIL